MADQPASTGIACLTPPGKAAVATLAVRGPLAWIATRDLFRPRHGALPHLPIVGVLWLGQLGEAVRDEVILAVKQASPEVWLEIHCHGGPAVVRLIESLYAQRGIELCAWQELERRTAGPAWQIAAQQWLVQAPTQRTAAILLDQYAGAFHRAIEAVRSANAEAAREMLERLAGRAALGRHLVQPWSVVIAGPPNVGKSSLVNALAGYTRSIVAPTAGTTRDVVTTTLAIDGWPVALSDTAGQRAATAATEAEGIARAHAAVEAADLCLWTLDGSDADASRVGHEGALQVINKIDLPAGWDWSRVPEALRVSARTGAGLPELCDAISRRLVPNPPAPGEAVPFSPESCAEIESLTHPSAR
jgi:tRNA modification GTPase